MLAGYCLASFAVNDDRTFISIVLKADSEETRCLDSIALFEYGFANYKYHTILIKGHSISSVKVVRKYFDDSVYINILENADYTDILTDKEVSNIKESFEWDNNILLPAEGETTQIKLIGPISSGQIVGRVKFTLNGKILAESELLASRDALKGDFTDKMVVILDLVLKYKYIIFGGIFFIAVSMFFAVKLIRRHER